MSVVNAAVPNFGRRWAVWGECGARDATIFCGFGEREAGVVDVGVKAGHLGDLYKLRTDSLAGGAWSAATTPLTVAVRSRWRKVEGRRDMSLRYMNFPTAAWAP